MKTSWVFIAVIATVSLLHAFKSIKTTGIRGKVKPKEAVSSILAISKNDSIKIIPTDGVFQIKSKPGKYKILMTTKKPYKDVLLESVLVTDFSTTDLGVIHISQAVDQMARRVP